MSRWKKDGIEETNHKLAASRRLHRWSWNMFKNNMSRWEEDEIEEKMMSW
jgi:hypothetical protein